MASMLSINDLVLQLQLFRDAAPSGTVPVQAAIYLAINFGRPQSDALLDKELTTCSTYCEKPNLNLALAGLR